MKDQDNGMYDKIHQCTFSTEQALPDNPGIYYFFLSGLHRSRIPDMPNFRCQKSLEQYVKYITHRIEWLVSLKEKIEWEGEINEKKSPGVSGRLILSGRKAYNLEKIKKDVADIDHPDDMGRYIAAINKAIMLSGPIYVGMTERQSISTRYGQHLRGSKSLEYKQKNFGERLSRFGISWGDLAIGYIEYSWQDIGLARKVERVFHTITNPFLSVN